MQLRLTFDSCIPKSSVQEVSNDVTSQEIIAKEVTEFMLTAGSVRVSGAA
jgi:hypothetical protein